MAQDDLVNISNQAKAKACIHDNNYLDQRYPKDKRPLKMKDFVQNKQLSPKNSVAFYSRNKINSQKNQSEASEKPRKYKENKKMNQSRQRKRQNESSVALGNNYSQAKVSKNQKDQKKKQQKAQEPKKNVSGIIYHNSNKKSHYSRDCTKAKKAAILTTSMSVITSSETNASDQALEALQRVLCIQYPV